MTDETTPGQLDALNRRLDDGDKRMSRIEANLAVNTKATADNTAAAARIENNIAGLLEWFTAFEGAFKVLNGIGKLAKPVSYIAGAFAAVAGAWFAFRGHK